MAEHHPQLAANFPGHPVTAQNKIDGEDLCF